MRVQAMDPGTGRHGQISRATGRASEIDPLLRRISHTTGYVGGTDFLGGDTTGFLIRTARDALQQQGVTVRHPLIGKAERESPLSQIGSWSVEEGLATQADGGQGQGKYEIHGKGLESGSIRVYTGTGLDGIPDLDDMTDPGYT